MYDVYNVLHLTNTKRYQEIAEQYKEDKIKTWKCIFYFTI